jgi:hypothetical protein
VQSLNKERSLELGAVLLTACGHLVTNTLGGHGVFIACAVVFWAAYGAHRARQDSQALSSWGIQRPGLFATWRATRVFGALALISCVVWGIVAGRFPPPVHALLLVLLYPVWGVVQQTLVQGFVVRHLDDALGPQQRWLTVLLGASAFGVVHVPHVELMAATFLFGLVATPIWLKHRNVWPLAFWHGTVGCLFYYFVLGRDPWVEAFAGLPG